jgi:hypothetical protein
MGFSPGAAVLVQWSDGNRYEGRVVQHQSGQVLVGFPNGQQQWVGEGWVAPAAAPAQAQARHDADDDDHDDDDGVDYAGDAQRRWNEMQQLIARVESQRIPLAGVDPARPVTWGEKQMAWQNALQQGVPQDAIVRQLGFRDADHFNMVQEYVEAKWSYLGVDDEGHPAVLVRPEYYSGVAQAAVGNVHQMQAQAAAADPSLLAPVGGVSVEQWARGSVALGSLPQNATPQMVGERLAAVGLDKATYDAANAGWQAKMQRDTTGAIAQKFAEAFAAAQGQAGGWTQGTGAAGGEPCTFDRYCEIMAAMACWSEQGHDVNAKLQQVFGINAMEYSRYSSHWGVKMATDMNLMNEYMALDARYRQKYAAAGMDDDLRL